MLLGCIFWRDESVDEAGGKTGGTDLERRVLTRDRANELFPALFAPRTTATTGSISSSTVISDDLPLLPAPRALPGKEYALTCEYAR